MVRARCEQSFNFVTTSEKSWGITGTVAEGGAERADALRAALPAMGRLQEGGEIAPPSFPLKFQFLIERRPGENFGRVHVFPYFKGCALRFKREEGGAM